MAEPDSFLDLMTRLRGGEDDAAEAVFRRFLEPLIGVARTHLGRLLRSKVDPEDVVQSAYRSFFLRARQGQFEWTSWDGLWRLLARITVCKCVNRMAFFRMQKRDATREASTADENLMQRVIDSTPTAEQAAILVETTADLLRGLDADSRPILELLLQGHTVQEVSSQTGWAERTVRRVRQRARERLERWREESPG
jgi:RNA polymerase sigma-70 factor (ECF subfamily)